VEGDAVELEASPAPIPGVIGPPGKAVGACGVGASGTGCWVRAGSLAARASAARKIVARVAAFDPKFTSVSSFALDLIA